MACNGETQTFSGFPSNPSSRSYTCTRFSQDETTFMRVDGLAFSLVIDGGDVDGIADAFSNCPFNYNPKQVDLD